MTHTQPRPAPAFPNPDNDIQGSANVVLELEERAACGV
jgi:hypothetical protein